MSAHCAEVGLSSAWGRIFFVYGPYEHPSRLVPSVIRALRQGVPARCTAGTQLRDFLHVRDVAAAFVALLDSTIEGPVNIGSGQPVEIRRLIYAIADTLGRRDLVELGAALPASDPLAVIADVARLHDDLGWSPEYDLGLGYHRHDHVVDGASGSDMRMTIDTDTGELTHNLDGTAHVIPLYSPEAFSRLSALWLTVGWNEKYTYTFSWLWATDHSAPRRPDAHSRGHLCRQAGRHRRDRRRTRRSLIFYASLCHAMGRGRVIGVDVEIRPHNRSAIEAHELARYVTLIEGDSGRGHRRQGQVVDSRGRKCPRAPGLGP